MPSIVSITEQRAGRCRSAARSARCYFLGDTARVSSAPRKTLRSVDRSRRGFTRTETHFGAILCAASDGKRLVTGGDDGKLDRDRMPRARPSITGDRRQAALDRQRRAARRRHRWHGRRARPPSSAAPRVTRRPSRCRRPSAGSPSRRRDLRAGDRALQRRDAVVSQHGRANPEFLEWAGSHLAVTFSPDNKFLVTAMHEAATAWLAACRQQAHADERLSRPRALDVVERAAARASRPQARTP